MLATVKAGACRRCGGRLFRERDVFGDTLSCIQCGATYTVPAIVAQPATKKPVVVSPQKVPVAAGR